MIIIEISKLFKQLREERHVSQRQLVEGISQRSTLSSFETNGSRIAFHLLEQYLERMNVDLDEFQFLLNHSKQTPKKQLSQDLYRDYYNHNYEKVRQKLSYCLSLYEESNDFYYYHLYAQYSLILEDKKYLSLTDTEVTSISKKLLAYFSSIENWGRFEYALFSNTLFHYEDEFIYMMILRMDKKESITSITDIHLKLKSNAIIIFLKRKNYNYAKDLIASLDAVTTVNHMNSRLLIHYFKGILLVINNQSEQGFKQITQVIETFRFTGETSYADELQTFSEQFTS